MGQRLFGTNKVPDLPIKRPKVCWAVPAPRRASAGTAACPQNFRAQEGSGSGGGQEGCRPAGGLQQGETTLPASSPAASEPPPFEAFFPPVEKNVSAGLGKKLWASDLEPYQKTGAPQETKLWECWLKCQLLFGATYCTASCGGPGPGAGAAAGRETVLRMVTQPFPAPILRAWSARARGGLHRGSKHDTPVEKNTQPGKTQDTPLPQTAVSHLYFPKEGEHLPVIPNYVIVWPASGPRPAFVSPIRGRGRSIERTVPHCGAQAGPKEQSLSAPHHSASYGVRARRTWGTRRAPGAGRVRRAGKTRRTWRTWRTGMAQRTRRAPMAQRVRMAQRARRCWRALRARRARRAPSAHPPPHSSSHRPLRPLHKPCPP
eukprot:gene22011-biopygen16221